MTREFPQHLLDMNRGRGSKLGLMMKHYCFFLPCRITIKSIKPSSEQRFEFPEAIRGYSQDIGRENEADAKITLGKRGRQTEELQEIQRR